MKKFNEFISEEKNKNITVFFAHYRSVKDPKHDPYHNQKKDPKHDSEKIDEGFEHTDRKEKEIFKNNIKAVTHHTDIPRSKEEVGAIHRYTKNSRDINKILIGGGKIAGKQIQTVKHLDKATNNPKNKLPEPITTYSGINSKFHKALSKVSPGETVHSPAYVSSTLHRDTVHTFAHTKYTSGGASTHAVQFHLPRGYSKGTYVEPISDNKNEHEVLLARNQKFKYLGKTNHKEPGTNNTYIVHHLEPIQD